MAFCGLPVPFDAKKQGENGHTPGKTGVFRGICPTISLTFVTAKMFLYDRAEYNGAAQANVPHKPPRGFGVANTFDQQTTMRVRPPIYTRD